ncbi:MAG: hypothetical protein K1X92_09700 [Bacteroidia bacterium]|nr:hypothetical protein [Bacteroidia bacterium]
MKSSRNNLFLFLFLVLLGLSAWYLLRNRGNSSFKEGEFAVTDTTAITRIMMTPVEKGQNKPPLTLEKNKEGKWILNGKYPVLEPQLHYFFKTLSQLKVKEKFKDKGNESAIKALNDFHLNVEIFAGASRMKAYQLGHEFKTHEGSIMRLQHSDVAYVVSVPGYKGYLNARFPLEPDAWRENVLFEAKPENLLSVTVTHHWKPEISFSFTRENINSLWMLNQKPAPAEVVNGYFSAYKGKVYAESFADAKFPGKKAELEALPHPDIDLTLKDSDGKIRTIHLFLRQENKNNYFGWVEGENQLLTIQHFVIDRYLTPSASPL